jgi:hypothetical protein
VPLDRRNRERQGNTGNTAANSAKTSGYLDTEISTKPDFGHALLDVRFLWLGSALQLHCSTCVSSLPYFLLSCYTSVLAILHFPLYHNVLKYVSTTYNNARRRYTTSSKYQNAAALRWSLTFFQRSVRPQHPKPSMSVLSRISKLFKLSNKASHQQTVATTPLASSAAVAATSRNPSRLAKQTSLESTSTYATSSVPSTISSWDTQDHSYQLDNPSHRVLENIPSTDCLLEEQENEEKLATTPSPLNILPSTAEEPHLFDLAVSEAEYDAATSTVQTIEASQAVSSLPVNTQSVDNTVDVIDNAIAEDVPPATQAPAESTLNWGAGSWGQIFNSDSSSSSLCEIVQESINEQTLTRESDIATSEAIVHTTVSPALFENALIHHHPMPSQYRAEVAIYLMRNPEDCLNGTYTSATQLQRSVDENEIDLVGDADDVESLCAPREPPDSQEQATPENAFIARVIQNATPDCRWPPNERDDTRFATIIEEDESDTSSPTSTDDIVVPTASSETQDIRKGVFTSDSGSSSLRDVALDPIEEQTSVDNSDTDSIESMYRVRVAPVYYYPVEPGSFGEAANILFREASNGSTTGHCTTSSSNQTIYIGQDGPEEPSSNDQERDQAARPTSPNPSHAQWAVPSWADIFSSDSSSSSLCHFADSDTEEGQVSEELDVNVAAIPISVDAYHSTLVPASTAIQVTVDDDEEEDDPFSEKQVRISDQPDLLQQLPIFANSFMARVYENANPNFCYRYRAGRHNREALLGDFSSIPTIFEEEETLEVHVRASASHDSLLAVDRDSWEYERVSLSSSVFTGMC